MFFFCYLLNSILIQGFQNFYLFWEKLWKTNFLLLYREMSMEQFFSFFFFFLSISVFPSWCFSPYFLLLLCPWFLLLLFWPCFCFFLVWMVAMAIFFHCLFLSSPGGLFAPGCRHYGKVLYFAVWWIDTTYIIVVVDQPFCRHSLGCVCLSTNFHPP